MIIQQLALKSLRHLYTSFFKQNLSPFSIPERENEPNKVSKIIFEKLSKGTPCMIARYGAFELSVVVNYLSIINKRHSLLDYIIGKQDQWWWNEKLLSSLHTNAGFFPIEDKYVEKFCNLMIEDTTFLDTLICWDPKIQYLQTYFPKDMQKVGLLSSEPFWAELPWTRVLEGKKVLVIHPFAEQIQDQYDNNREKLFNNSLILPLFHSLKTIKAVQSIAGQTNGFDNWFDALDYMKEQINSQDFDICLLGCGAYGFPLAAHIKRMGKQAVHLGGSLQLLFGIWGSRWDGNYSPTYNYVTLKNEFWQTPYTSYAPKNYKTIEGGCYW